MRDATETHKDGFSGFRRNIPGGGKDHLRTFYRYRSDTSFLFPGMQKILRIPDFNAVPSVRRQQFGRFGRNQLPRFAVPCARHKVRSTQIFFRHNQVSRLDQLPNGRRTHLSRIDPVMGNLVQFETVLLSQPFQISEIPLPVVSEMVVVTYDQGFGAYTLQQVIPCKIIR